jgi:hypothetical protein
MVNKLGIVFAALFVLSIGLVAADTTLIAGTTYDGTKGIEYPITGANVTVECNGNVYPTVSSEDDGTYTAAFKDSKCGIGDTVNVYAVKGDLTGWNNGTVGVLGIEGLFIDMNFEDVDVPMIPEFGLLVGSLTVVAAITVFFVIRRH